MGGLKNVYALGSGLVAAAENNSATAAAVYFSNATAEMVLITHLVNRKPEALAGPLLADTYVTLLKGRNAWYGEQLGRGKLHPAEGDYVSGEGQIQGVSATVAFYELLSDPHITVPDPAAPSGSGRTICPIELCPILEALYLVLTSWQDSKDKSVDLGHLTRVLRNRNADDPRVNVLLGQHADLYIPDLLHPLTEMMAAQEAAKKR